MMTSPDNQLTGLGLTVTVAEQVLLDGVDIEASGGEVLGLIGPNGAGKTTLLKVLAGVMRQTRGKLIIHGDDADVLDRRVRARRLAYLPQDATVHWPLTVAHTVALGRLPHASGLGRRNAADEAAIRQALERTETLDLQDRSMHTLSGGERMRALVARMLAVQADILLADEPVTGLDPYFQLEFMDLFAEEARSGRVVVLVLHDLSLAARYCHKLLLLDAGKVVTYGTPEKVLTPQNLAQVYRVNALTGHYQSQPYVVPWQRTVDEL